MKGASGRQRSEQARVLRSLLLRRMAVLLLVWLAVFAGAFALFEVFVSNELGEWVAEHTSEWEYIDAKKDVYIIEGEKYIEEEVALEESYEVLSNENTQIFETLDGRFALRDLSVYKAVRAVKIPLAIVVFVIGALVIVVRTLNKSLRYFDDLANAVASPGLLEGQRVELPKELTIASQQLELLQTRVRDHEQAAVFAEQRKNELVAYLAHDIRTPLTSVLGYLELLAQSPDLPVETRAEYAGIALEKANRLEELVEEFFEITRYNLDSIVLERQNADVSLFARQVADEFGVAAQERGISIEVEVPDGQTAFIDASKMARALGNVVKNAVAYANPDTVVRMRAAIEGEELAIEVSDEGREISQPHLERIFERFYREDGSRGQGANAGLGLAIAREIVEAHGGAILAESSNGLTTFTLRVPR